MSHYPMDVDWLQKRIESLERIIADVRTPAALNYLIERLERHEKMLASISLPTDIA